VPKSFLHRIREACPTRAQWAKAGLAAVYGAAVVVFLVSIGRFYHKNTGFTALIHFGSGFYDRTLPAVRYARHATAIDASGYDGQFYAQLAVEPLLRNRALEVALDGAPYRARRILFSWTAYLLGLGQPEWILKAYALQNILVWLALAGLMLRWLPPSRPRNVLPWLGCLYGAGLLSSVHESLLDGPSVLVMTLAILALERHRKWLAIGLMGLSGLGRETNLAAGGLVVDRIPRTPTDLLSAAASLVAIVLPLVLWSMYVQTVFPTHFDAKLNNFGLPFAGYLTKWSATVAEYRRAGWHSAARFDIMVLVALTVQAVFVAVRWDWKSPWWRMAAPCCVLFATTSFIVWDGTPGAAPRVLLPLTFAFNMLVAKLPGRWFWPLVVAGNASVVTGLWIIEAPGLSTLF
jgi:hypothetical protein